MSAGRVDRVGVMLRALRPGSVGTTAMGHGALSIVFYAVGLLLNLVTGVLVARGLGADGRGELTAILTWASLVGFIGGLGCTAAVSFAVARDPTRAGRVMGTWLVVLVPVGALVTLGLQLVLPVAFEAQTPAALELARLFALSITVHLVSELLNGVLLGTHDFWAFNLWRVSQFAIVAVAYGALMVAGDFTVANALIANAGTSVLTSAVVAVRVLRRHRLQRPDLALGRAGLSYGLRSHLSGLGQLVNGRLDLAIMPAFLLAASVGVYAVASTLATLVIALGGTLSFVVLPAAVREGADGARTVVRFLHVTLGVGAAAAAVLGLLAPLLVRVVYGTEFDESVLPLRILLPGSVLYAAALVLGSGLASLDRPLTAGLAQVPGLVITLVGLPLFLRSGGVVAAAAVSAVAYSAVFVTALLLYKRAAGLSWDSLSPGRVWRPRRPAPSAPAVAPCASSPPAAATSEPGHGWSG